jgi:hypothetical protein
MSRLTQEQCHAIDAIYDALPEAGPLLDEFANLLSDVPNDDLDREINNVGHVLMLTLKKTAPELSEAQHYGLPFAFIEKLRSRMRETTASKPRSANGAADLNPVI